MNIKIKNKYSSLQMYHTRVFPFCFLLLLLASCSKDKQIDMDILTGNAETNAVSYVQGGDVVSLNGQNYNFTNAHIGVPIPLTERVKAADTVVATVDPALVETYNKAHLENNMPIPDGAFAVTHDGLFPVAANAAIATDSLYVLLKDGNTLKNGAVYLVPVRLSAKKGAKLKYSIFYFKIRVNIGQLKVVMDGATLFNNSIVYRYVGGGALNMAYINAFPDSLRFSVKTSSIFPAHDVKVEAAILDDVQTDSLNRAKNFGASPFPADTYSLSKSVVTVGTKSMISTDSITVRFKNRANFTPFKYYLLSIRLKHYKGSAYGVPPVLANDSSSAYIRFFLF